MTINILIFKIYTYMWQWRIKGNYKIVDVQLMHEWKEKEYIQNVEKIKTSAGINNRNVYIRQNHFIQTN